MRTPHWLESTEHRCWCFLKDVNFQVPFFGADPWKRAVLALAVVSFIKQSSSLAAERAVVLAGKLLHWQEGGTPGSSPACSRCCSAMDGTEMPRAVA